MGAPAPTEPAKGSFWRHVASGKSVVVRGFTIFQAAENALDDAWCVSYWCTDADGSSQEFTRPVHEFMDGRFEPGAESPHWSQREKTCACSCSGAPSHEALRNP